MPNIKEEKQLQTSKKLAKKVYNYLCKSNYDSIYNTLKAKDLAKKYNLSVRKIRAIVRSINMDEQFRRLIISTKEGYYMPKKDDLENSLYHIVYLKRMAVELLKRTEKMVEKVCFDDVSLFSLEELPTSKKEALELLDQKKKIILKNKVVIKL